MKKLLSIILSIVILLGAFSVVSFAESKALTYQEKIINAIHNMETEVDLSEYKIKYTGEDEILVYLQYLFNQYPEYYYWNIGGGTVNSETGEWDTLQLAYFMTKEQMLIERMFMENETNKVINKIGKDWSEAEKALYVHDWLDVNYMYDYNLFEKPGEENHDIVGFLKYKRGVCQSYAYTYMYILRRMGINSYYVISETDNHGWNVVQIDGKWYHVDATYDDPILGETYHYDYVGEVRHDKFLLSDSQILEDGGHDDFYIPLVDGIVCNEYKGNASWRTATTAVHKIGEYWYYLDNSKEDGGLMRTKDFKDTETLMKIGCYVEQWGICGWERDDGIIQNNYYAGLFEYNGHLFFNDETDIYVYDSHHNKFEKVPIDRPEGKYYYGLNMEGKTISYLISPDNIFNAEVVEGKYTLGEQIHHYPTDWEIVKQPTKTEEGEQVKFCYYCADIVERQTIPAQGDQFTGVLGDANGDGKTDAVDLAALKLFLAGIGKKVGNAVDFNSDNKIDAVDLARLKLKLAGL